MRASKLHLIVPGALNQKTGGYLYDARIVSGLRSLRWDVEVHELAGKFPSADVLARSSLTSVLSSLPDQARVVIDGLVLAALSEIDHAQAERLRLLGLVHHPLADETGLGIQQKQILTVLERRALSECCGVLVTSKSTAFRLRSYGVNPQRVRVVPPGTDRVSPSVGPEGRGEPMLLCVGSVIPRKGQDVLVRALSRVRHRSWSCVCVGSLTRDTVYAKAVQEQVRDGALGTRIRFSGECDSQDLNDLYDASSIFILASYYEGYGMALSEALTRGLPVISTTGGAIPETVPERAGILVPPGDHVAFATALDRLLCDAPLRLAFSLAARQHGETLPDWGQASFAFANAVEHFCLNEDLNSER